MPTRIVFWIALVLTSFTPPLAFSYSLPDNRKTMSRAVQVSSDIALPVSATTAFDTFSDLPRQPTWSSWLKRVEYIEKQNDIEEPTLPEYTAVNWSKWTMGLWGLRYSWKSFATLQRPTCMVWKSVSGLKTTGMVKFTPTSENSCHMELVMTFVLPRAVAFALAKRDTKAQAFVQNKMLQPTLQQFSQVVQTSPSEPLKEEANVLVSKQPQEELVVGSTP